MNHRIPVRPDQQIVSTETGLAATIGFASRRPAGGEVFLLTAPFIERFKRGAANIGRVRECRGMGYVNLGGRSRGGFGKSGPIFPGGRIAPPHGGFKIKSRTPSGFQGESHRPRHSQNFCPTNFRNSVWTMSSASCLLSVTLF